MNSILKSIIKPNNPKSKEKYSEIPMNLELEEFKVKFMQEKNDKWAIWFKDWLSVWKSPIEEAFYRKFILERSEFPTWIFIDSLKQKNTD